MSKPLTTSIATVVALALSACGPQIEKVDFKDGFPSQEMTSVALPKEGGSPAPAQNGIGTSQHELRGDLSGTWVISAASVLVVNTLAIGMISAVTRLAARSPSEVRGEVAVFGPQPDATLDITWKLTTTRTANNAFSYVLEAKRKDGAETTYAAVLSGTHTVAVNQDGRAMRGYGSGTLLIDYDHAGLLPGQDRKRGTAEFRYARMSPTVAATLEIDLAEYKGAATTPVTTNYRYSQVAGGEGSFSFGVDANLQWWDLGRPALERWTIRSRWMSDGAGRSDVRATGGDLTVDQTLNECWDAHFKSTFLTGSDANQLKWGVEATDCAFASAAYVQ